MGDGRVFALGDNLPMPARLLQNLRPGEARGVVSPMDQIQPTHEALAWGENRATAMEDRPPGGQGRHQWPLVESGPRGPPIWAVVRRW